ncbi:MAG: hypothetical protein IPK46_22615 [Saprospiraceae bacterium]|nr:hypothetical protein [Saprospiraceae bacterium]
MRHISNNNYPFGAGIQQEITFKGLNYGFSGKIEIPNADDGGASSITINSNDTRWITLWSDTEIKVLISSIAPDHPMVAVNGKLNQ